MRFRFSVNIFGLESRRAFVAFCRDAERESYDAVYATDHLGVGSPFPLLVAAADATRRLRVGTLVLNVEFWNPVLLARDIATTDILTDGRLEIGLGAGHMKWEFDRSGIEWEGFTARTRRLESTITTLRDHFGGDGYSEQEPLRAEYDIPVLRPIQRRGFGHQGPPLIVGGTGERILRVAAEYADIVSIAGAFQIRGRPPGTFRIGTAAEAAARVAFTRDCAGDRANNIEWHTLLQAVCETEDRRGTAEALLRRTGLEMPVDRLLDSPFLLIGTVEEMARQILDNRDRLGLSHYTVHAPYREAFAPVMARTRTLAG
ncbi:TIGR03621 family F420-dependent LLM class oxidoreductase [Rhodococcus artemisiae]|uniref:TIGR03621 family F420-dependent LLM class oxidoreductase n=1 Tax=Rhodococcus artemisiae TaxID=714159 RepID=A0ABU7L488_9NOCA|nr:TIGR03621 family F420-dependent LLM class oxidoreductase [Rhodococcus artemisiae]MEE2056357.1 TIGR03621 family F420-dependent LLM class oxidoreductase [Rhodococcus artemisiae]